MKNLFNLIFGIILVVVCALLVGNLGLLGLGLSAVIFILAALVSKKAKCEVCGATTKGGSLCGDCLVKINSK